MHMYKAGYPRKYPKPISPFSKWPGPPPGHYIFYDQPYQRGRGGIIHPALVLPLFGSHFASEFPAFSPSWVHGIFCLPTWRIRHGFRATRARRWTHRRMGRRRGLNRRPISRTKMFSIIEGHLAKGHIQVKFAGENPGYWTAPIIAAYSPPRQLQILQEPDKAGRRPLSAHQA
jgi:hypothetical protein